MNVAFIVESMESNFHCWTYWCEKNNAYSEKKLIYTKKIYSTLGSVIS